MEITKTDGTEIKEQVANLLLMEIPEEDFFEYKELKKQEQERIKKAKADYNRFKVDTREDFFKNVPSTKHEEVLTESKLALIEQQMKLASDKIIRLNSPLKEQEIADLKLNFRSTHRQLAYAEVRLGLLKEGQEVKNPDGFKVLLVDVAYTVDKLRSDLHFIRKDLAFFGLNPGEVLK